MRFSDPRALNLEVRPRLWDAYERVMERGSLILGPETEAFEAEFAEACGYRHAIGVASGYDALRLILLAAGVGPGDQVIVPANTYIATWESVSAVGAIPVPVEPDERTGQIDPGRVLAAIVPQRTRAIVAAHLYGRQADVVALRQVADKFGLRVFVDAAQGHGLFGLGEAAAFSFYPTKNLGALGDGGAVVTDDGVIAGRVRLLRHHGMRTRDVHEVVGGTSRLDELQAAFLREKLKFLGRWNLRRLINAQAYAQAGLGDLGFSSFDWVAADVHHLHVVRHPGRDAIRAELARAGIETLIHYPTPPHLQPAYSRAFQRGQFPITERLAAESLSLPVGPEHDLVVVNQVVHALRKIACELREAA